jgi:sugar phosphate permease
MILHKIGARVWLARIMIVWGIVCVATLFVTTPLQFYTMRFILGVAEAGFYPGALLYLTYWFPRFARGQAMAVMLIATNLSSLLGGPLAGTIMSQLDGTAGYRGWQWLFFLEGLPATIFGIIMFLILRNGPNDVKWLSDSEKQLVSADLEADRAANPEGPRHAYGDAFKNINIWCLVGVNFCNLCSLYGIQFWMPTIITQASGSDVFTTGLITAGISLLPIVVLLLFARSSDRMDERRWHTVAGFAITICGLVLAAVSFGSDPRLTLGALVLVLCGVQATSIIIFSLPATFVSGAAAATGFALITTLGNFAGYASPYMIGLLRAGSGSFSVPYFGLAAMAILGAILILLTPGLHRKKPRSVAASVPAE